MNFKLALPWIAAICIITACQPLDDLDNVDSASFDADYAIPLVNTHFSLKETLESFEDLNTIYVDEDGLIHFQYFGDLLTQNSDVLFESINESIGGVPIPIVQNNMPIPLGDNGGFEFDHLVLKEGQFVWYVKNPYAEAAAIELTFPQIVKDGNPFTVNATVDGEGEFSNLFAATDIAGYEVIPDPATGEIYVEYVMTQANGEAGTPEVLLITFNALQFHYMEGYMGVEAHKGKGTIIIDFFDDYVKGDIYFADPKVTFYVENSFGIPTRSQVNAFKVYTVSGDSLDMEGEYIDNGIDFPYPGLDQVGEKVYGEFVFDRNNSNIDVILGAGPLSIYYDVDAITNPDEDTAIRGFLTDSSYYDVRIGVDLPLYGRSVDFLARDTFEIDFNNYDRVDEAEFKMVAENELPLEVQIQGYFHDERGEVLDSLFEERQLVIAGAEVDEEGNAIATSEKITYIKFSPERFDRIRTTEELTIVASFYTSEEGQKSVYILDSQNLSVRLGAILGVSQ